MEEEEGEWSNFDEGGMLHMKYMELCETSEVTCICSYPYKYQSFSTKQISDYEYLSHNLILFLYFFGNLLV